MATERPKRLTLLSEIRRCRRKLEETQLRIDESARIVTELNASLNKFSDYMPRHKILVHTQAQLLKHKRRKRIAEERRGTLIGMIAGLESDLAALAADEKLQNPENSNPENSNPENERVVAPGWRWIRGLEGRYVWSTDGRVGSLTKSRFGSHWILKLLTPVRRGTWQFSAGGVSIRRSFTAILSEGAEGHVVAEFSPDGPMHARMIEGGENVLVRGSVRGTVQWLTK